MQKRVFLEADVDEHRLQAHLDVLDFSLVDAADNIARGVTLDAVFFQSAILEQGNPPLELFHADDDLVSGLARRES